jgi:hypothetical protein
MHFQAIEAEPEASLVAEHLNSLARCVELLGVGCISETYMADLVRFYLFVNENNWIRKFFKWRKYSNYRLTLDY